MRAEIRYLTDGSGRRWHLPLAIGPDDQFSIEWGDPPIIEIRRPLPKRWWQRQSYDVLVLQLRPETDSDVWDRIVQRVADMPKPVTTVPLSPTELDVMRRMFPPPDVETFARYDDGRVTKMTTLAGLPVEVVDDPDDWRP